ncbi:response regulator transcription factor [Variovorax sp. DT-64]|uniref:response regulator transcription factor n=1 Tax=Variovorax sp. DT-64 TaxID=3396160 RepID=UPI003F194518
MEVGDVTSNPSSPIAPLSAHEITLLRAMAAGSTNAQLAALVGRSEKTIRNQLSRLYLRLGARNRTEAVAIYLRMNK